MSTVVWHHSTSHPPQLLLLAPPLCQHMCINIPKAAAAAANGNGRDNASNVDGGHPSAVGDDDAIASIMTTVPCPNMAPPPSSVVNTRLLGGFTSTHRWTRDQLPLCCSARKPGTILSFSGYSHLWWQVNRWRNTTINRSWGLGVELQQAVAAKAKALSSANNNHQRPPSPSRNTHSSDRGCSVVAGSTPLLKLLLPLDHTDSQHGWFRPLVGVLRSSGRNKHLWP